jgi:hypothetical protein
MEVLTIGLSDCPIRVEILHILDGLFTQRCSAAVDKSNTAQVILGANILETQDLNDDWWHLDKSC